MLCSSYALQVTRIKDIITFIKCCLPSTPIRATIRNSRIRLSSVIIIPMPLFRSNLNSFPLLVKMHLDGIFLSQLPLLFAISLPAVLIKTVVEEVTYITTRFCPRFVSKFFQVYIY
eukprot:NODE_519_length_7315_cov_0.500554.p7 type:complete len:116 gc:universal NODE_519_length_7315_cov_0.500554:6237-6584(+)